ncbi:cell wall-binding repeat-containing protein [Jeotgalibacillus proteolyticus]|uniref:cell wall-binding repeat-containing protein n=1 Tax=Jeotgalibacillus proteolyticus TaxID=2082395 RepID=UPI003CED258B
MQKLKVLLVSILLFSCFSFSGQAETAKNIVVIDPGHGGMYSGTKGYSGASTGYFEKHANLEVSLKLKAELLKRGYEVVMTRETDRHLSSSSSSADLRARMSFANNYVKGKNDQAVFISVHHNATGTPSYRGYETYYFDIDTGIDPNYPPDPMQIHYSPESKKMARAIHTSTLANAPIPEGRGMVPMDFYVTRNAQMPSVLLEVGYMSNPTEEKLIKESGFQQKVAVGVANGVDNYFDTYTVYDHNGNAIYSSSSKESALNYAKARKNVRVVHIKSNQEIFSNISYPYGVYHASLTTFKQYFTNENEAIAFAEKWKNTRVIDNERSRILWSNYLTPDFHVIHSSKGVISREYDEKTAITEAKKLRNTNVVNQKTKSVVWSNYMSKNYEVLHDSKGLLTSFYNEQEAVTYSKLWKNTKVKNKSNGKIIYQNADPSYSYSFKTDKVSAADRMLTAISVSKELYPNGFSSNKSQKTVVLATAFDFADALTAGPYAAQLDNAPILLTRTDSVSAELKNELKRLKTEKVVIIGGTGAVSNGVLNQIKNMGYTVERVSGSNRYETNLQINAKLKNVKSSILVSGTNYPDALGATPVAVNNNSSIVLAQETKLREETAAYLQNKTVTIVGGTLVVSETIEDSLKTDIGGDRVVRLSGKSRYETLAAVLTHFKRDLHSGSVLVSTGTNFPDALTASSLSKKYSSPLILVGDRLHPALETYMTSYGKEHVVERVITVGGVVGKTPLERIVQLSK